METLAGFSGVAIIVALVELLKGLGIPTRFAPLFALLLGVGLAFLSLGTSVDSFIAGLVGGLSASGLWSGTKAVIGR